MKFRTVLLTILFIGQYFCWLDNFPVRGRKDYPLLFDAQLKPKKAYWEVIK